MIRRPQRSPLFPSPTPSRPHDERADEPRQDRGPAGEREREGQEPDRAPRLRDRHDVREMDEEQRPERERERSEEHTSELQSQSNLVCRLLLEKKRKGIKLNVKLLTQIVSKRLHLYIHLQNKHPNTINIITRQTIKIQR